ncbi:MAG: ABC transporter permease [Pseudomonadota bacterium]
MRAGIEESGNSAALNGSLVGKQSAEGTAGASTPGFMLALRFAVREMRGGLSGFYIFLACIMLGVGAIAGVNSVGASISRGIASEGQAILGGDVALSVVQQNVSDPAIEFGRARGTISQSVTMRAMARLPEGEDQTLVELKAADDAYPLYGELTGQGSGNSTDDQIPIRLDQLGSDQAWADPLLLERLSISVGDTIDVGSQSFTIVGEIENEPDRLSGGLGFGPRLLISSAGLEQSGLVQPGSLYRSILSVRLDDASEAGVKSFIDDIGDQFPQASWRIRSRENAAPALSRNIQRFSQFLTLVGLTALIVGGVGVANSVRAYLETKRNVIATFKSLGAPGSFIFETYLIQIILLALAGIAGGLLLGMAMPLIAREALRGLIPVASTGIFDGFSLALGAVYGLLAAFIFAVWPLGKARETPATALFRSSGFEVRQLPRPIYLAMMIAGLASLISIAIVFSGNMRIAGIFIAAIAFAFVLLRAVSALIQWAARKLPPVKSTELRMAIGNIYRPGSLTPSVVLSLGLGLALICALTLIDGSLRQQVSSNIPKQAPAFFFVDIQSDQIDPFTQKLAELSPDGKVFSVPMLRGRVTALKGIPSEEYKTEEGQWVLRGDRGITYARNLPENSTLSAGEWWPEDYSGEPLVSFAAEEAGELGLEIGDKISVNVLGRPIEAKIANLRNVEWETLSINFVMVFSPNTFAGAPHGWLSTLTLNDEVSADGEVSNGARDGKILREVTKAFPTVTSVRVRDAIDTVNTLIGQLATAIRAASSVALVASLLVLAGALAAGNQARLHDSVVLKTLGARRATLIRTFVLEYAMLGFVTAIFAMAAGGIAAWFVITQIMEFPAVFAPGVALTMISIALAVTIGLGLAGTWRILGHKVAPVLREL